MQSSKGVFCCSNNHFGKQIYEVCLFSPYRFTWEMVINSVQCWLHLFQGWWGLMAWIPLPRLEWWWYGHQTWHLALAPPVGSFCDKAVTCQVGSVHQCSSWCSTGIQQTWHGPTHPSHLQREQGLLAVQEWRNDVFHQATSGISLSAPSDTWCPGKLMVLFCAYFHFKN